MKLTTRLKRKHDGKIFHPVMISKYIEIASDGGERDIIRLGETGVYHGYLTRFEYTEVTVFPANTRVP